MTQEKCQSEISKTVLPILSKNIQDLIDKAKAAKAASETYIEKLAEIENGEQAINSKVVLNSPSSQSIASSEGTVAETEILNAEQICELLGMERVISGSFRKSDRKNMDKIRSIFDPESPGKSEKGSPRPVERDDLR